MFFGRDVVVKHLRRL